MLLVRYPLIWRSILALVLWICSIRSGTESTWKSQRKGKEKKRNQISTELDKDANNNREVYLHIWSRFLKYMLIILIFRQKWKTHNKSTSRWIINSLFHTRNSFWAGNIIEQLHMNITRCTKKFSTIEDLFCNIDCRWGLDLLKTLATNDSVSAAMHLSWKSSMHLKH